MPFSTIATSIAFPNIDPVLISIGPLQVHWYGLAYVAGILFAWWYANRLINNADLWNGPAPIKSTDLDDFLTWAVIGIILGGRLGYVLFYDLPTYLENPLRIGMLWQGGMSFHGGLTGCILAMILFARSRQFSVFVISSNGKSANSSTCLASGSSSINGAGLGGGEAGRLV